MEINRVERNELNVERWNALVRSTPEVSFFSYAWYLDEVAENWCVFVDDHYTTGIAIPYTVRLSKEIAYTPIFVSYLEVLGENFLNGSALRKLLTRHFSIVELSLKSTILGEATEKYVTQILPNADQQQQNSQARRMLTKAKKNGLKINPTNSFEAVFTWVKSELKGKFTGMTDESLSRLKNLFLEANKNDQLLTFEVQDGEKCVGGIICLVNDQQIFYLKGACNETAKRNGGMYLALQAGIEYAKENKLLFDFGGSRVPGVQGFNKNLGGIDLIYYFYKIDSSPFWYKWLRRINSRIKKR